MTERKTDEDTSQSSCRHTSKKEQSTAEHAGSIQNTGRWWWWCACGVILAIAHFNSTKVFPLTRIVIQVLGRCSQCWHGAICLVLFPPGFREGPNSTRESMTLTTGSEGHVRCRTRLFDMGIDNVHILPSWVFLFCEHEYFTRIMMHRLHQCM